MIYAIYTFIADIYVDYESNSYILVNSFNLNLPEHHLLNCILKNKTEGRIIAFTQNPVRALCVQEVLLRKCLE